LSAKRWPSFIGSEIEMNVIEQEVQIHTPDGTSDGVLYVPGASGRWPGVLHLTDIGGIRNSHREMARRLSEQGYVALMPNVFYRTRKPPVLDFPFTPGESRTTQRLAELSTPLTPEAMERDASAYIDFLAQQSAARSESMAVVGYCFTGAMAMRAAAALPDRILAAASFHGGRLVADAPISPHLQLPRIKARLYFGHATNDNSMNQGAIAKLDVALAAWKGRYESEVYEGAFHGWTVPDSPVYNQPQAERAFKKLTMLLVETLSPARQPSPLSGS
jgi:carboxymethylenebutenolidase